MAAMAAKAAMLLSVQPHVFARFNTFALKNILEPRMVHPAKGDRKQVKAAKI
jgi:hypothetical protein